ncbi:MAG: hypothetical protein Q8Q42_02925 [Nanoarchaeota archaeon]|nr:hypothetical protein [Nanoarchaeota archaeon]
MALGKLFIFLGIAVGLLYAFGGAGIPYLKYLVLGFMIGLGFYLARN